MRNELEEALRTTTESLSRATRLLALVSAPTLQTASVRHIEVLALQPATVMVVVITSAGSVTKRFFTLDQPVDPGLVGWAHAYLNEQLVGERLGSSSLRRRLDASGLSAVERSFVELIGRALLDLRADDGPEVFVGGTAGLLEEARAAGLAADFSLDSIAPLLRHVVQRLESVPVPDDPDLPWWIRQTPVHQEGLFEWTEESGILVMRASWYLGESFVRSRDGLHWDIGSEDRAEGRMPVVAGFPSGAELPPIEVADNLLRHVVIDPEERSGDIETAVETWRRAADVK
jgi:hypothetical protein